MDTRARSPSVIVVTLALLAAASSSSGVACDNDSIASGPETTAGGLPRTIGPAGGVVEGAFDSAAPGVRLEIPPGALDVDTAIDIRTVYDRTPLSPTSSFVGDHFAFTPTPLTFKRPARLTLPLRYADVVDRQSKPTDCKVWMRDGAGWQQRPQVASTEDSVTVETSTLATAAAGVNFSGVTPRLNGPVLCTGPTGYCFTKLAGKIDASATGFATIHDGVIGFLFREDDVVTLAEYDVATGVTTAAPSNAKAPSPTFGAGQLVFANGEYYSSAEGSFFVFPRNAPKRSEGGGRSTSTVSYAPVGSVFVKSGKRYAVYESAPLPTTAMPRPPSTNLAFRTVAPSDTRAPFVDFARFEGIGGKLLAIPDSNDFFWVRGSIIGRFNEADILHPDLIGGPDVNRWLGLAATSSKFAAVGAKRTGGGVISIKTGNMPTVSKSNLFAASSVAILTDGSVLAIGFGFMLHFKNDDSVVSIDFPDIDMPIPASERFHVHTLQALPNNEAVMFIGASSGTANVVKVRVAP